MSWTYSLSPLFKNGETFRITHKSENGIKSSLLRFDFGKTYQTNDDVLIQSLKKLAGKYPITTANTELFNRLGVEFEKVPCKSCGGRVIKYQVPYFFIKED